MVLEEGEDTHRFGLGILLSGGTDGHIEWRFGASMYGAFL